MRVRVLRIHVFMRYGFVCTGIITKLTRIHRIRLYPWIRTDTRIHLGFVDPREADARIHESIGFVFIRGFARIHGSIWICGSVGDEYTDTRIHLDSWSADTNTPRIQNYRFNMIHEYRITDSGTTQKLPIGSVILCSSPFNSGI